MRKAIYLAALLFLGSSAAAQAPAQADISGSTPVIVAHDTLSQAQLSTIKRDLGVQSATAIGAPGTEVWQVPNSNLLKAFSEAAKLPKLSVDYRGNDYRTLFLPVSNADLQPAASAALARISQDPHLSDVQVVRLRANEISKQALLNGFGVADGLPSERSLILNVRPGLNIVMKNKSLRQSGDQVSWSGTTTSIVADPAGTPAVGDATLIARGDRILGSIQVGTDMYSVVPLSNGLHAIAKVNQGAFPPEHPPQTTTPGNAGADAPLPIVTIPRVAGPADVMIGVAYTQAAADEIQANYNTTPEHLAAAVIELTNLGYEASQITSRLKLAGTTLVAGTEAASFDDMVKAVVDPADGAFDGIHSWRTSVKADAVLVFVSMSDYCGMAADVYTPKPKAFAIVNWRCSKDNLSFPHEFGHLLGARHDPDTDPSTQPFAYAHGYRVQGWRTVMAYTGGVCSGCPRLNRWANPNQQYLGVAMGTSDKSYDAKLIEEMLPIFSRYYP